MSEITMGLLSWKRPQNMQKVVTSIADQNCKPEVWLWNNDPDSFLMPDADSQYWTSKCDVIINSSRNMRCGAWAAMMSLATTEFIGKIDDDLMPLDHDVIGDCIEFLRDRDHDMVIGMCGVALDSAKRYPDGVRHTNTPLKEDLAVDVVKGRFWITRRAALMKAPPDAMGHHADISWLGFLSGGRRQFHCIPGMLRGRFKGLDEGGVAACEELGHYEIRERIRRQWFSW